MASQGSVLTLLFAAFVLANLPWLNHRFLGILPYPGGHKPLVIRLFESLFGLGIVALLAWRLEAGCQINFESFWGLVPCPGEWHAKGWEFYTIAFVLYAVFALPGVIWQVERRRHHRAHRH